MHPNAADGELHGHVPARPECITPHIRFLFIAPQLWIGLPSDPASRRRPCPSPCLRLCTTWPSDFHRRSNAPCPAHTLSIQGRRAAPCRCMLLLDGAATRRKSERWPHDLLCDLTPSLMRGELTRRREDKHEQGFHALRQAIPEASKAPQAHGPATQDDRGLRARDSASPCQPGGAVRLPTPNPQPLLRSRAALR